MNLTIEYFVLRDDIATCEECRWRNEWVMGRMPNAVMREAKRHADREGHQVTLKRVQFTRYTGRPRR